MIYFDRRKGYDIILCPNAYLIILSSTNRYSKQYTDLKSAWDAIDNEKIEWEGYLPTQK